MDAFSSLFFSARFLARLLQQLVKPSKTLWGSYFFSSLVFNAAQELNLVKLPQRLLRDLLAHVLPHKPSSSPYRFASLLSMEQAVLPTWRIRKIKENGTWRETALLKYGSDRTVSGFTPCAGWARSFSSAQRTDGKGRPPCAARRRPVAKIPVAK